ncbi:MAG: Eco47II family restriction endonuclease [Defluviitaleaceae bacterium]|nr:Eco47II family restriction endonuclease [Defluviitaleaceae bacterium]
MWPLSFISEDNLLKHVEATIQQYGDKLEPYNLEKFNKNIIDPVKLIFDKTVYKFSWEEIVKNEIFRQRDKSNNNDIGYFHQRVFQYIAGCDVPASGWDVVFAKKDGIDISDGDTVSRVFVEMKNKHNTMNSSASGKTYIRMQSRLLADDDCACFLVEVIAKQSQNIAWTVSVDSQQKKHRRIRRVSIDKFYSLVTGQEDAFYQMCMVLPDIIEKTVFSTVASIVPKDSVISELKEIVQAENGSFALTLYMLGFSRYNGFLRIPNL